MKDNFENCLAISLPYEGGYVNHPKDPGGPTNKGITQRTLSAYLGRPASIKDVKTISTQTVKDIYKEQYWDRIWGDKLPLGLDLAVFDYAVNSGISQAVKTMQREVGIKADGVMGLKTLDAINVTIAKIGLPKLVQNYCTARYSFLKKLRTWGTFGAGWTRRVMGGKHGAQDTDTGIIDYATKMAKKVSVTPPKVVENPGKANPEDVGIKAIAVSSDAAGPTAVATGTAGEMLNTASSSIMPYADVSLVVKVVCVGLIVIGAGLTFYTVWKKYKRGEVEI